MADIQIADIKIDFPKAKANRGPYTATIGGHSWSRGPVAEFPTISECREFAEEYGTTADYCTITDAKGREIASHRRDPNGDGTRWFRARV